MQYIDWITTGLRPSQWTVNIKTEKKKNYLLFIKPKN